MAVFAAAVIAAPPKPGVPHPFTAPARKIPGYGLRPDPGYHGVRKRAPWHGKNPGVPHPVTAPARKIPGYGLRPNPGYQDACKPLSPHALNPGSPG